MVSAFKARVRAFTEQAAHIPLVKGLLPQKSAKNLLSRIETQLQDSNTCVLSRRFGQARREEICFELY